MKISLIALTILFSVACNAKGNKTLPVTKTSIEAAKAAELDKKEKKKEEDCDDKAKKPIEIKAETISLSGNTGCSLDEAK